MKSWWVMPPDSGHAGTQAEDGPSRRGAAHILDLMINNGFPQIWTPSKQERDQRQLLIHRYKLVTLRARVKNELQHLALNKGMQKGRSLWSKQGQKLLLEMPLNFWAGARQVNRPEDYGAGPGSEEGSRGE